MELLFVGLVAVLAAKCRVRLGAQMEPASVERITHLRLIFPSGLSVSASGFPGSRIRVVDSTG
jgi:hypothetical protein